MLRKLRNNILKIYNDRPFLEQQKALTLFYVSIAIIFLVPTTLSYSVFIVNNNTSQILIPHGTAFFSVFMVLFVLKKGKYIAAANLLISLSLMSVWSVMFFDKLSLIYTIDTVSFVLGLMTMLPLIVLQKRILIFIYTAINLVLLFIFTLHIAKRFNLSSGDSIEFMVDNALAMIFIAVVSYLVLFIYDRSLKRSEMSLTLASYEAENNRELNRTLEARVEERTEELKATLHEMEFMNDNLHSTNRQLEQAHATMAKDMIMASAVQLKYLPQKPPVTPHWQCSHYLSAMATVSGDFFDYYFDGDDFTGLGLFDVSGHGIASGMVTMIAKSIISRNLVNYKNRPLGEILTIINDELISEIGELDYFMTGIILRLKHDSIEYCNAGHQPPYLYRKKTGTVSELLFEDDSNKGSPLGNIMLRGSYGQEIVSMTKGDSLLLFTDGLFEALSPSGEEFDLQRVVNLLKESGNDQADEIIEKIKDQWQNHVKNSSLRDDITALILKRV